MGRRPGMTLERLEELALEDLRAEWARRCGAPVPNLSPDLLRLGIGYKLQEAKLGGLSKATRALLRQAEARSGAGSTATPTPRTLTPGTRLVRDWHGVGHTIVVLEDGFEYLGKRWKSLSAIARAITGAHWNGPRFFGITERRP